MARPIGIDQESFKEFQFFFFSKLFTFEIRQDFKNNVFFTVMILITIFWLKYLRDVIKTKLIKLQWIT